MKDPQELLREWKVLEYNGNGHVSLAEIDKWTTENYPLLTSKPALMRAYKRAIRGGDNDFVEKNEFKTLLRYLVAFHRVFEVFSQIDSSQDRRVDFEEFKKGLPLLGIDMTEQQAKAEFDGVDTNHGGIILFDEFCHWVAVKKMHID